jgi:GrpB-like predicted nucleotidyltransferase (UPF0157 family)
VHVCQQSGEWERVHLLFRDYLRSSDDARETYAAAKREAARVWGNDRPAYTEAKSDVILGILARPRPGLPPPAGESEVNRPPLASGT